MSPIETSARPIAITIIDIFAILIPGFVWLVLLVTTFQLVLGPIGSQPISPVTGWRYIAASMKDADFWLAPLSLVIVSVLIGYLLKPTSLTVAEQVTRYLFKLRKNTKGIPVEELRFPFNGIYRDTELYKRVLDLLEKRIGCSPETLPGHQPFSAAKRYLRLMSPSIWEESERMEAEVRMIGVVFLASLYSILLSAATFVVQYLMTAPSSTKAASGCWFVVSILAALILAEGFNRLRVREVGYTYVNVLLVSKLQGSVES